MINDNDAFTISLLQGRRDTIVASMSRYVARPDNGSPTTEHREFVACLFDATLASLRGEQGSSGGSIANDDRRSLARFGDGLIPILKDIVGPDLPSTALLRVSDAYWRMINSGLPAAT